MKRIAILLALGLIGCGASLAAESVQRLRDVEDSQLRIYQDPGGTPLARQYSRFSFCAAERVLLDVDAAPLDAGGAITCEADQ